MTTQHIAEIHDGTNGAPLHIRVLRRWTPYKRSEICLLLVDNKGDAIEAVSSTKHMDHLTNNLLLNQCYSLENYICTKRRATMRTFNHNASIMLAKYTQATPIQGDDIPLHHFNFVPYDQLATRTGTNDLLTGCLVDIRHSDDPEEKKKTFLELKNDSDASVRVTLWPEIRTRFNATDITSTEPPVIVAATAMKVNQFTSYSSKTSMQLSSTAATSVFINPPVPELPQLHSRFKQLNYQAPTTTPPQQQNTQATTVTISEAMDIFNNNTTRKQLYCVATITDILTGDNKSWYYTSCNQCNSRAFKTEATDSGKEKQTSITKNYYKCFNHPIVPEVILRYCVSATLEDATGKTIATLFDEPMTKLVGENCSALIKRYGHPAPDDFPPSFQKLIGTTKQFAIQQHKDNNRAPNTCVVSQVLEPPCTLLPPTPAKDSKKRPYQQTTAAISSPQDIAKKMN